MNSITDFTAIGLCFRNGSGMEPVSLGFSALSFEIIKFQPFNYTLTNFYPELL